MTNPFGKTLRHASIYAIGDIARYMVSFVMLPIYTRYLSPADYGVVELLTFTLAIIGIFTSMRMGQAILRFFYDEETTDGKNRVITTSLFLTCSGSAVGALILFLGSHQIAEIIFGDHSYAYILKLYSVVLFTQSVEEWALMYIRARQRPFTFVSFNMAKLILQLGANLVFVVAYQMHVMGVVYGSVIVSGIMMIVSLAYVLRETGFLFSSSLASQMLKFSYPLWLSAIPSIFIGSADLYFLRIFYGLEEVGLFSLSMKFGILIIIIIWDPFEKIWSAQRFEIAARSDAIDIYRSIFTYLNFMLAFAVLGLGLFSEEIIHLMAAKDFYRAYDVVPILVIANAIPALVYFNNFSFLWVKKTGEMALCTYLTMALSAILYISLIPLYGAYGAAFSILISNSFQLVWTVRRGSIYYDLELPWARVASLWAWMISVISVSVIFPADVIASILLKVGLVVVFIIGLLFLPILIEEDRRKLRSLALAPNKAWKTLLSS